jgi:hypothetical protein
MASSTGHVSSAQSRMVTPTSSSVCVGFTAALTAIGLYIAMAGYGRLGSVSSIVPQGLGTAGLLLLVVGGCAWCCRRPKPSLEKNHAASQEPPVAALIQPQQPPAAAAQQSTITAAAAAQPQQPPAASPIAAAVAAFAAARLPADTAAPEEPPVAAALSDADTAVLSILGTMLSLGASAAAAPIRNPVNQSELSEFAERLNTITDAARTFAESGQAVARNRLAAYEAVQGLVGQALSVADLRAQISALKTSPAASQQGYRDALDTALGLLPARQKGG